MEGKPVAELNAEIAEAIFAWKDVHRHEGRLIGKKPDKLGRMRTANVPDYAGDPAVASAIDDRMKELGKASPYLKELARLASSEKLPVEWATPEQRVRAALSIIGKRRKK